MRRPRSRSFEGLGLARRVKPSIENSLGSLGSVSAMRPMEEHFKVADGEFEVAWMRLYSQYEMRI